MIRSKIEIHNQKNTRVSRGRLMLYVVGIFILQKNLKQIQKKKKIEIDEQNSEDIDHIGDDKTNSEEYASVLRQSSRGNIEI